MKGFFFDYIYYRLAKFYIKWDGENGITALIGVSMIQCLIISELFLITERIVNSKLEIIAKGNTKIVAYIAVALFLFLLLINWFKYRNKYSEFENQWKEESTYTKLTKGFFVLVVLIIPWIFVVIIAKN
ncbi:MAG: hypothetical protein NTZ19_07985 [Bacteroidetes bacterium]|nr:hypothetical protein [Bacteroidota bacterium]